MLKNWIEALRRAIPGSTPEVEYGEERMTVSGTAAFEVLIEPDEVDGGYVATCTNLPGAASQGETPEEAFENLGDAISGVLSARLDRFARDHAAELAELLRSATAGGGMGHVTIPLQLIDREHVHA